MLLSGQDALIRSETGSGKTLSFLVPALASLQYPPELYPEDLKGPQALIVVPTMELGVQVSWGMDNTDVIITLSYASASDLLGFEILDEGPRLDSHAWDLGYR